MSLPRSRQFVVSVIAACAVLTLSVFAKSEPQAPAQPPPRRRRRQPARRRQQTQGGRALSLPRPEPPRTAGRSSRRRPRPVDDRAGLLEEAAGRAAVARRAAEEVLAAARIQDRAGAHRSRHPGAGADCVRRQRPDVRRSSCAATCRTPTRPASSIRSAASRCTRTRTTTACTRRTTVFVDHLIFPRFVMPFGANAILRRNRTPTRSGSTPTRTTTASPTRRSSSPPAWAGC